MTHSPMVTVVIPSYNQSNFLEESLKSVVSQNVVVEAIVVDGGSTDNSLEIIKKYEQKLEIALKDYSDYADIWNNLGIVHLIQCRNLFLQALGEFKRALEINPAFDKARKNKKLVENDGKEFLILLRGATIQPY